VTNHSLIKMKQVLNNHKLFDKKKYW